MDRLDRLPARDSMRFLLIALAILFVAQATYVPAWISVFSYSMLGWRWLVVDRGWPMPGRVIRTVLAILVFGGVFLTYGTLNGAEAGSALLMVMIALKLTEVRKLRDSMLVIVLGFFLVFAGFIYSQEIPLSAWLLFSTFALTSALMILTRNQHGIDVRESTQRSGRLLMQAAPFAIAMFILFPRLPGPLWGVPSAGGDAVSGLSDRMTPGSITSLVLSNEIAFRVEFDGPIPPPAQRYWRGPVLHFFNGRTWSQGFMQFSEGTRYIPQGPELTYTVTIEPHEMHWLFSLPLASRHPGDTVLTRDYYLASARPVNQRRRYTVTSQLGSVMSPTLEGFERRWALQVPERFNPESQQLAAQWRTESTDDIDIVNRALQMFREQPFHYTLQPPPLRGNTVDDFIFNTRRGFCEHYASAFTFLMRAAGVPARVVTGYQGGEFNPVSGDFVVRQSDAHAWSEVWIEGQGWTRVDPTGAVSPSRIELGISGAFDASEDLPAHIRRSSIDWVWEVEMRWEAINAAWNEFFLAYGPEAQSALLGLLGLANADWLDMVIMLAGICLVFGMLLAAYLFWMNLPPPPDAAKREFDRLRQGLEKRIGKGPAHEGPRDFVNRASESLPQLGESLEEFAELYLSRRYAGNDHIDLRDIRNAVTRTLRDVA